LEEPANSATPPGARHCLTPGTDPAPRAWTVAEAQKALGVAAGEVQRIVNLLDAIHAGLPEPSDIEDRQEGRKPCDRATDILATIECILEDSLLCRARHKISYAESRIMPIALRRLAISR
jgi:hypothetical protein